MVGWESYKQAILQAEEQFHKAFEEAWDWHQGEIAGLLKRPMATPEMGRVSMARAVARFWSRTEKIGMNLAGEEQKAFENHIRPLREKLG